MSETAWCEGLRRTTKINPPLFASGNPLVESTHIVPLFLPVDIEVNVVLE